MTRFGTPWLLLLLLLIGIRLFVLWRDRRAARGSFVFSSASVVEQRRTFLANLAWLPLALELAGWALLIVALARPQQIISTTTDRFGIDIVIALDASGSMAAEDFSPRNRFTVAKELISEFIDRRVDDRIGIVTFGARAATRVPLTFDRAIAREVLERSEIGENGDGTAIGHAIATAVNRARGSKAQSRVIILVTDGVNNAGSIEPTTAAALAQKFGVKIYTIGVGSRGPVPIPVKVQNRFTGEIEVMQQFIRADLDEEMLSAIAQSTGGHYFRAVDEEALQSILNRIDRLEKSRLAAPRERDVRELYATPLVWGLSLVALAFVLGESVWMLLPA
jgi:Ca-activated chloride channel family protein